MNPSTRDLAGAAQGAPAASVILLPNNPNIVSTAQQAVAVSDKPVHVIPTASIPQGVAALLAFNPALDLDANLAQMQEAVGGIRSGEVTTAVRSTSINGVVVLRGVAPTSGSVVTLYWGGDASEEEAEDLIAWVSSQFSGVEAEVVHGGQPHYHYLVSVE